MRIGVVSDTHDNDAVVIKAVRRLRARSVDLVLHCGDIATTETIRRFTGLPTHFVFGNWDGDVLPQGHFRRTPPLARNRDHSRLRQAIADIGGTVHEPWGELTLDGCLIGWVHGNHRDLLRELEQADYFDYLFHGHTHEQRHQRIGRTLVVNPGALFRADAHTFAILTLPEGALETVTVT